MKIKQVDQKQLLFGVGGLVLVLMVVFVFGKMKGRSENEQRDIDVKVNIKDEDGQTVTYDPNELLIRLNKGLTTTYFFKGSAEEERCKSIEELYQLDAARFIATIKAYEEKYNASILTHIKACYFTCYNEEGSMYKLIEHRINHLKKLIN